MKAILQLSWVVFVAAVLYVDFSWKAFQHRNPRANDSVFYSEFPAVITWKRLPGISAISVTAIPSR